MNKNILPELIKIQCDLLRVATATTSARPLMKKYHPKIEDRIKRIEGMEIDTGSKVLLDFLVYLLEDEGKKNYIIAANLVGSFLLAYSSGYRSKNKVEGKRRKKKQDQKSKRMTKEKMDLTRFLANELPDHPEEFESGDLIKLIGKYYEMHMGKELSYASLKTYASHQIKKMKEENLIELIRMDWKKRFYCKADKEKDEGEKDGILPVENNIRRKISENKDFLNEVCQ